MVIMLLFALGKKNALLKNLDLFIEMQLGIIRWLIITPNVTKIWIMIEYYRKCTKWLASK